MPVEDHPVHERTKIGADFKYGCFNHPSRKGASYYAPNRIYRPNGTFLIVQEKIETEWIEYETCPAKHDHQGCLDCVHGGEHERVS